MILDNIPFMHHCRLLKSPLTSPLATAPATPNAPAVGALPLASLHSSCKRRVKDEGAKF